MGVRCDAVRFSALQVADAAALRPTTWTIACCVRIEKQPGTDEIYALISKGSMDADTKATYLLRYQNDSVAGLRLILSFRDTGGTDHNLYYVTTLTVGRWYAIAGSWDNTGKDLTLYLTARRHFGAGDASTYTAVATENIPGVTPDTTVMPVNIGATLSGPAPTRGSFASATFSEVAIYNAVIAKATLDARLGQRLTGAESGLVGYWRLDDGLAGVGGSTAYDRTGNGRNATLLNRPQWSDDPTDLFYPRGIYEYGLLGWYSPLLGQAATLTASSEATGYPATNLRAPSQARTWRTANVTGAKTLVVDFGRPVTVSALTLDNHNLTSTATITVALHTADSWGTPSVSETVTYHPGFIRHVLAKPYQFRYARLSLTDASNGDGYIEVGSVHLWHCWEWFRAVDMDAESYMLSDPSTRVETQHGTVTSHALDVSEGVTLAWPDLAQGHARRLEEILSLVATGRPVWACPDVRLGLYPRSIYGYVTAVADTSPGSAEWGAANANMNVEAVGFQVTGDRA